MTRMGATIEQIWTRKTSRCLRASALGDEIWIWSADHHTGQRLLKTPHTKA